MRSIFLLLSLSLLLSFVVAGQDKKPAKITIDELLTKHLAAIGTPEDIAAAKTRVIMGDGRMLQKTGAAGSSGLLEGPAQIASDNDKVLFAIAFPAPTYPYEKAAFDGKDATVGVPATRKTQLAEYLRAQPAILKDGLFAGVLSSAWPLLDIKSKKGVKVEMGGTGKVDGRDCYKVKYSSSRTGELKVTLFFDAETFRHVRTEYEYQIQERIGASSTDRSNSSVEYYKLVESFSDFNSAGKLTIPATYDIAVAGQGQVVQGGSPGATNWTVHVKQVYFDQVLDPGVFKVS